MVINEPASRRNLAHKRSSIPPLPRETVVPMAVIDALPAMLHGTALKGLKFIQRHTGAPVGLILESAMATGHIAMNPTKMGCDDPDPEYPAWLHGESHRWVPLCGNWEGIPIGGVVDREFRDFLDRLNTSQKPTTFAALQIEMANGILSMIGLELRSKCIGELDPFRLLGNLNLPRSRAEYLNQEYTT